jgi:hypothetical protein
MRTLAAALVAGVLVGNGIHPLHGRAAGVAGIVAGLALLYLFPRPRPSVTLRISLTEQDFRALVHGMVVTRDDVQIALQDIGWNRMMDAIAEATDL